MKSDNIAVTDARLKKALNKTVTNIISSTVPQQINDAINQVKIYSGTVTKFYHYLDKAEVELSTGELVLSVILHRFGGDLVDYYSPNGDEDYCENLHEPCILPKMILPCMVIYVDDLEEYVLLGYFNPEEIEEHNPASMGNVKLDWITGINEYWIKFGEDGLDLRLPSNTVTNVGTYEDDMDNVDYPNLNDVYTKDEVYTKAEVEELIQNAISEALGEEDALGEDDAT